MSQIYLTLQVDNNLRMLSKIRKRDTIVMAKFKDVLHVVATISTEVNNLRRIEGRVRRVTKKLKPKTLKSGLKLDRERTIVNMYNSGHYIDKIWKVSGYKSCTSVFRVLNRHGVQLNRGRHQGPLKKRSEKY